MASIERYNSGKITKNGGLHNLIDNYIYLYHVDKFIVLPVYADNITDSIGAKFSPTEILGRSAPIQSYSGSGPRTIDFQFDLHRDLMTELNLGVSTVETTLTEDYVDKMIKYIQAIVLPSYQDAQKLINPPMVAVRMGNDIFIKGVVAGSVSVGYNLPILADGRYAKVHLGFSVTELEPYDAETVMDKGSFRGLSTTLAAKVASESKNW